MAGYSNPGKNYMSDSDEPGEAPHDEVQEAKDAGADQPVAILPKSILAGKDFKPGEEVVLKIVEIHDDEVVVEYAPEKGGEGEEGGGGYSEPQSTPEMQSLMEG